MKQKGEWLEPQRPLWLFHPAGLLISMMAGGAFLMVFVELDPDRVTRLSPLLSALALAVVLPPVLPLARLDREGWRPFRWGFPRPKLPWKGLREVALRRDPWGGGQSLMARFESGERLHVALASRKLSRVVRLLRAGAPRKRFEAKLIRAMKWRFR